MTARDPNIEQDVRAIVQRIVDGLVDGVEITDEAEIQGADSAEALPSDGVTVIAIGADHGGYPMKERLGFKLKEQGFTVVDCGTDSTDAVDYPDIAVDVCRKVVGGEANVGIIIDGAGIGSSMAANKVPGIRAALCHDISTARNAREHNHANVLTLGAGLIGDALAGQIVAEFIATPYGPGRHARRVDKIDALDRALSGVG